MVQLSNIRLNEMRTFGKMMKGKVFNHRKPLKYQRFQDNIDPSQIVAHYSRDDLEYLHNKQQDRTFKDAQNTLSKKNYLLPNLSATDLELNKIFQEELNRQRGIIARVNKIQVIVDSVPGKGTDLLVDQHLATPYECAQHVNHLLTSRTIVAELLPLEESNSIENKENQAQDTSETTTQPTTTTNTTDQQTQLQEIKPHDRQASIYWDMHRPLEESCRLRFRHFNEQDVSELNKIYWRSCSFIMGMAIRLAFKDEISVLLHSWPKPNIKSGSFVYDAALNLDDKWNPSEQELRAFTKIMWSIKSAALPFDHLKVNGDKAKELFSTNPFKLGQIDSILENESSQGKVTVYRCGGLLDISVGPMISNTSQIGRITLAAVHPFEASSANLKGVFYRFQGVSLPQQLPISSYLYQNILINSAKKINRASL